MNQQSENKEWKSFVKDKLSLDNERMQIILGGHRPGDGLQGQAPPPPGPENMVPEHGQMQEEFVRPDDDDDDELFNFDDPEIEDNPGETNDGEFFNFFSNGTTPQTGHHPTDQTVHLPPVQEHVPQAVHASTD